VCIGTDGVWEAARADGVMFGKQRLRDAIRAAASGSAREIERHVVRALTTFLDGVSPADDVTFIVVKLAER
jgi:sigma-B regulation protein RsbU (phosphoserine phosphatase)